MSISYQRSFHANLYYHVLSLVDLDKDTTNLHHRPGLVGRLFGSTPDWTEPLAAALQSAPGARTAQILPLVVDDLPELYSWLLEARRPFDDWLGRNLAERLLVGLRAEERQYRVAFVDETPQMEEFRRQHEPLLERLLAALWDQRAHPPLRIVDCDALHDGEFTHARCYRTPVAQTVAVSLQAGEQALLRILHEATHAITDPQVLGHRDPEEQSTRPGTDGYTLHLELERAAVEHDANIIGQVCPELIPAHSRFQSRYQW